MFRALNEAVPVQRLAKGINFIVPLYTLTTTSVSPSTKIIYLPLQCQSCWNLLSIQNTSLLSITIFEANSRRSIIHRATSWSNIFWQRSNYLVFYQASRGCYFLYFTQFTMWVVNSDAFLLVLRECEEFKFLCTVSMCTYCKYGYLCARTERTVFSHVRLSTYTYSFLWRKVFAIEEPC